MAGWTEDDLVEFVAGRIGTEFSAAWSETDSTLELRFADGVSLSIPADDQYEAWEVRIQPGDHVVCLPGGGIARWSDL